MNKVKKIMLVSIFCMVIYHNVLVAENSKKLYSSPKLYIQLGTSMGISAGDLKIKFQDNTIAGKYKRQNIFFIPSFVFGIENGQVGINFSTNYYSKHKYVHNYEHTSTQMCNGFRCKGEGYENTVVLTKTNYIANIFYIIKINNNISTRLGGGIGYTQEQIKFSSKFIDHDSNDKVYLQDITHELKLDKKNSTWLLVGNLGLDYKITNKLKIGLDYSAQLSKKDLKRSLNTKEKNYKLILELPILTNIFGANIKYYFDI